MTIINELSLEKQFHGFLSTPQIFAENAIFEYPYFPTLIDHYEPKPLKLTEPSTRVLGKRMEHFFTGYIQNMPNLEMVLQNQQIFEEKQTLGELDFLLRDHTTGEISHVELVYKYYLFDPETGTSEIEHFIGPNKRDSLIRKLESLKRKQFPLLFHPATREVLKPFKIHPENVVQKMCFKAHVFLPKEINNPQFSKINPETISGYWIKSSDFTEEHYGKNLFFTPKKAYWPVAPQHQQSWFSFQEIMEQIIPLLKDQYAPLLWMKTPEGEFKRFFIVWW